MAAAFAAGLVLYGSALHYVITPKFNPKIKRQRSAAAAWEGRHGQLGSRTSPSFGQCHCLRVTQAKHSWILHHLLGTTVVGRAGLIVYIEQNK